MALTTYYTTKSKYIGTDWVKYEFPETGFLTYSAKPAHDNSPRYILAEDANDVPQEDEVGTVLVPMIDNAFPKGQIIFVRSGQGKSLISQSIQKA